MLLCQPVYQLTCFCKLFQSSTHYKVLALHYGLVDSERPRDLEKGDAEAEAEAVVVVVVVAAVISGRHFILNGAHKRLHYSEVAFEAARLYRTRK